MNRAQVFAVSSTVTFLIGIAYFVGRSTISSDSTGASAAPTVSLAPPVELSSHSVQDHEPMKSANDASTEPTTPVRPANSGHLYRALDLLLRRPFPDQGKMVTLDVVSTPHMGRDGKVIAYTNIPVPIPVEVHARGVSLSNCIEDTLCVFDVIEQGGPEDINVERPRSAGAIIVEIARDSGAPSEAKIWDVEPIGSQELTLQNGTVLRLPKVRFWGYHASQ